MDVEFSFMMDKDEAKVVGSSFVFVQSMYI